MHRCLAPNSPDSQCFRQPNQTIHNAAPNASHLFPLVQGVWMQSKKINGKMMTPCASTVGQTDWHFMISKLGCRNQNESHFAPFVSIESLLKLHKTLDGFTSFRIVTPPFCSETGKFHRIPNSLQGLRLIHRRR